MKPYGVYESESVNLSAYITDKQVMHVKLPEEGWTGEAFEVVIEQDGSKTLVYI
jgi:hypothetical protein